MNNFTNDPNHPSSSSHNLSNPTSSEASYTEISRDRKHLFGHNEFLSIIEEQIKIGIWEYVPSTGELSCSKGLYEIFSITSQNKPDFDQLMGCFTKASANILQDAIQVAIERKQAFELELEVLRDSGEANWIRAWGQPELNSQGKVCLLKGAFQDISTSQAKLITQLAEKNQHLLCKENELASANAALNAANEELITSNEELKTGASHLQKVVKELEERNNELDQIVYKISHDIRAPLATIQGLINLMFETGSYETYLEICKNQVLKLDSFVHKMLDFAKSQRQQGKLIPINFQEVIAECVSDLSFHRNIGKLRIKIDIENHLEYKTRLLYIQQIFANIISNAMKYLDPNKESSYLEIKIFKDSGRLCIFFKDNGIGVDPQYLHKISQMFFRGTQKSEGSGLGLYIVRKTIEKMRGNIDINSPGLGRGLEIKIHLP